MHACYSQMISIIIYTMFLSFIRFKLKNGQEANCILSTNTIIKYGSTVMTKLGFNLMSIF